MAAQFDAEEGLYGHPPYEHTDTADQNSSDPTTKEN